MVCTFRALGALLEVYRAYICIDGVVGGRTALSTVVGYFLGQIVAREQEGIVLNDLPLAGFYFGNSCNCRQIGVPLSGCPDYQTR